VRDRKEAILGTRLAARFSCFPLLFKFIDAHDKLSIQVHPDDDYARSRENDFGKMEAWYVVHAEPGAKLICGLKKTMTREKIETSIRENNLEQYLNEFVIAQGDVIFVAPGTVHALESGTVVYEVQEVSDLTYRIYDWGRLGDDGKPRALHIEKSLDVINYNDIGDHRTAPISLPGPGFVRHVLAACKHFVLEKYCISQRVSRILPERFEVVSVLQGQGSLHWKNGAMPIHRGQTILVPAAVGEYAIESGPGTCTMLAAYVPESTAAVARELKELGVSEKKIEKLGGIA